MDRDKKNPHKYNSMRTCQIEKKYFWLPRTFENFGYWHASCIYVYFMLPALLSGTFTPNAFSCLRRNISLSSEGWANSPLLWALSICREAPWWKAPEPQAEACHNPVHFLLGAFIHTHMYNMYIYLISITGKTEQSFKYVNILYKQEVAPQQQVIKNSAE